MSTNETSRPRNRLAQQTSPYLRQHATNPVDWYPWGEEAIARARREDKPILLSVGYSACHWCHVMERESFEDQRTAAVMNADFVCIKVDREERPDLDEIYMAAVQLLTHHGGWPMTVFLTPDLEPYFGGTYFPPDDRHGLPAFRTVLGAMADAYTRQRENVAANAKQLAAEIRRLADVPTREGALDAKLLEESYRDIASGFDAVNGGFGQAPKFPSSMSLAVCLRRYKASGDRDALGIVTRSLDRMAAGGIHDHLGGGFHRYSVDARWLVPHFEKMLYDNALLARLYVEAFLATGDDAYRRVAASTLAYVRREMTGPEGGFHAALDADSEGVEGKFYVWTAAELNEVLGEADAALLGSVYDVTAHGNFEHGTSILHLPRSLAECARTLKMDEPELEERLEPLRRKLLEHRAGRVRPFRDEKVLVAWNGLMISALAVATRAFGSEADGAAAVRAAEFLWRELRKDGLLLHTWKDGEAKIPAFLDDTAALGAAFLDLYETTYDALWVERAMDLAGSLCDDFEDPEAGGFFYVRAGSENLIARSKNPYDNAIPGGNSLAVHFLFRLAALTGEVRFERAAARGLSAFRTVMERSPQGFAHMVEALDTHVAGLRQVVVAGAREAPLTRSLLAAVHGRYEPNVVVALAEPGVDAAAVLRGALAGKVLVHGSPAAYVCRRFACAAPSRTVAELEAALAAV